MGRRTQGSNLGTLVGLLAWIWLSAWTLGAEPDRFADLETRVQELLKDGSLIGAQVAFLQADAEVDARSYGVVAEGSKQAVDSNTLFLIASCSKPFASLCVLSMIDDPEVDLSLDATIDKWLPTFANQKIVTGGKVERAPTVEELLSHRAGLYSQKSGMTQAQARWIRRYRHDLEKAVRGISKFPLLTQPGTTYAYSGAGYCVLGGVAEKASGESFELSMQERICEPLSLLRTTYFPARRFENTEIATGSLPQQAPHQLGEEHRMPLIGGSLYSTATEMATFAQAVHDQYHAGEEEGPFAIDSKLVQELGKPRSKPTNYSLGWKVKMEKEQPTMLSHAGALYAYRAWMAVDLESGNAIAGCWTLGKRKNQASLVADLQKFLAEK